MFSHLLALHINHIEIKNFRCFDTKSLSITAPIVLLEGSNGAGKTSLFEALYYACYLRSFRTYLPRELTRFEQSNFFVRVHVMNNDMAGESTESIMQIGFSEGKKLVRLNKKALSSYKELMHHYRVVSLTEDDLLLVTGTPQHRRSFLDQIILLFNPDYAEDLRLLRAIISQRNALLATRRVDHTLYDILTEQLEEKSRRVREERTHYLSQLSKKVSELLHTGFAAEDLSIQCIYKAKGETSFESEIRMGRSLTGAHLDDITFLFQRHNSRMYASRGQQKLILLLFRLAQIELLKKQNQTAIFLLDDFMTDFDEQRARTLITLLAQTKCQLFFSSPVSQGFLAQELAAIGLPLQTVNL